MAPTTVFLLGATGETGASIAKALAAKPDEFVLSALVRPASTKKPIVKALRDQGTKILEGDLAQSESDFIMLFQGQSIVISAIGPQELEYDIKLANAAKAAGVTRFVPCAWMPIVPAGVHYFRDIKEATYNHIKRINVPYTIVDDGWWMQNGYPTLPSGKVDYAHTGFPPTIVGDGNMPTAWADLHNIGNYVARIILDPRTLNKYVLAYDEVLTHNEVYDLTDRLSGEKAERNYLPNEVVLKNLEESRKASDEMAKTKPETEEQKAEFMKVLLPRVFSEYYNTVWVRGDNSPEYAKYLGYLTTKELYPDVKVSRFEDVLRDTLEGRGYKVYADRNYFDKK